jgi:Transposase DNA-binding
MERKGASQMDVEGLEHPDKWAVETFGTAELGDLRRTDRLVKMATVIAELGILAGEHAQLGGYAGRLSLSGQ